MMPVKRDLTAGRHKTAFFAGCLWYESEEELLSGGIQDTGQPCFADQGEGWLVALSILP